jgi:hypothetical protein
MKAPILPPINDSGERLIIRAWTSAMRYLGRTT